MYSHLTIAQKYLKYWLTASNGKGHGVHSPFVFEFISNVLRDKSYYEAYSKVEEIRKKMLADQRVIEVEDFGAGSVAVKSNQRRVADIASTSLKPQKYAQLIFRIIKYYQSKQIIELGTSLGVTSAYMSLADDGANVLTLEGSASIADIAADNLKSLRLKNIQLKVGEFGKTLPEVLALEPSADMVFVDGNHRKRPTLEYFTQLLQHCHEYSILIFDDIHWSAEMEEAWGEIKNNESVTLSIDLFFIGIVFFRKDFKVKQHFAIRF